MFSLGSSLISHVNDISVIYLSQHYAKASALDFLIFYFDLFRENDTSTSPLLLICHASCFFSLCLSLLFLR